MEQIHDTDSRFAIDPETYGLPTREELLEMRIWDLHYHGLPHHEQMKPYFSWMGIARVLSLDVAHLRDRSTSQAEADVRDHLATLEREKQWVSFMIRIEPTRVDESLEHIDRFFANGPCVGIKTGEILDDPIT